MPKATASSPFSVAAGTGDEEEEEKTTIESGWEEEPSTTVEQGQVADQIRALGAEGARRNVTNVTSTNAGMLDEPTVDDQHANAAISMITPPMLQARLLVTGGNDSGQEVAVQPGKTYTIGRAVENDIVLTDIAVSRKHFDLKHEAGAWVLVDRGSGNGTLVNGNLEDHPFMLANGDAIEIGNTTFRFELPNGPPRVQSSFDVSMDEPLRPHDEGDEEEEPSTVAGKPLRSDELATPSQMPPRSQPMPAREPPRAKTMPPPAPMRPRSPSVQGAPMTYPPSQSHPQLGPMPGMSAAMTHPMGGPTPATTLPMPQHQQQQPPMNARPMGSQAPTMLGDAMGMQQGQMGPIPGMMPSTIPGQGPPLGHPQHQQYNQQQNPQYNPYPNNGAPPQNLAQMLVVNNGMQPGRDPTSTSIVPPTPYGGTPVMVPQQSYNQPTIPRKTKLILGGIGLTLFAAIATIAIIKGAGGGGSANTGAATSKDSPKKDPPKADQPKTDPKLTVQPIVPAKNPPPKVEPPKTDSKLASALRGDPPKVEPPKVEPPKTTAVVPPPKVDPPKTTAVIPPPKVEPPKTTAVIPPPKVEPPKTTAVVPPPKVEPPKTVAVVPPPKVEPPKVVKKEPPPKKEPKKKKEPRVVAKKEPLPKEDPPEEAPPKKEPAPKRVAVATGSGGDAAKSKAESLYKAKKFTEAASVLLAASKAASEPEVGKDLRLKAGYYASFGKNYNIGMAPATSAKDAWTALTAAKTFDNSLGGDYVSDINARMGVIAPKAAVAFMAGKDFVKAKQAVALAESSGNGNSTTQGVRQSLEQKAGELFKEATALQSSDPAAATQKFREIQRMVDSKSTWHQKAGKALIAIKG